MIDQSIIDRVVTDVTDMWNDRGLEARQETFEETLFWYLEHLKGKVIEQMIDIENE